MPEVKPSEFPHLIDTLRYFVATRRFGVVDRLGFAQSADAVREAIYEAIRTVRAAKYAAERVKLRVKDKEFEVTCLELEKVEDGSCTDLEGVLVEGKPELKGARVCCIRDVMLPSEEELEKLFEILREDPEKGVSLAKEIAALAFSFPKKKDVKSGQ